MKEPDGCEDARFFGWRSNTTKRIASGGQLTLTLREATVLSMMRCVGLRCSLRKPLPLLPGETKQREEESTMALSPSSGYERHPKPFTK